MDIFEVHRRIMDDYASYIRSFVSISDDEMRKRVEQHLNDGHLWPEPLLTFNPSFAKVGRIDELVSSGVLAAPLGDAFRGYELFEHQLEAIQLGAAGNDFVVTSGTGSGKSLTYIAAIFDHLFKTVRADAVKLRAYKKLELRPNSFFQGVYRRDYGVGKLLLAADHTGQLNYKDKQDREDRFRAEWKMKDGRDDESEIRRRSISSLFCSPTMELGIDIGGSSVVRMRNAPPNPANYAQRSGRAGRSGQPALVFTFCGSQSNHDRHYFNNQPDLVAGQVVPPRLDLLNEELLRTHLHAIFLSEIGLPGLKDSVPDLLDLNQSALPLREDVAGALNLSPAEATRVRSAFERAIADFRHRLTGESVAWFSNSWIDAELGCLKERLDESLERWRILYRSAQAQLTAASQKKQWFVSREQSRIQRRATRTTACTTPA